MTGDKKKRLQCLPFVRFFLLVLNFILVAMNLEICVDLQNLVLDY